MASYTIQIRKLCDLYSRDSVEAWFKSYKLEDFLLPEQLSLVINTPIWSKDKLAKKIVNHFFMREIGFETPELFILHAKTLMEEIMQSKLPLIYSTALEYDPLVNVDFTETFNRSANSQSNLKGNSSSSSFSNSSGLNIYSDTPQGQINKQAILNGTYASNTSASESDTNINDNTNSSSDSSNQNKEFYTRHLKGNQGISATYQAMIKQFRENIISVDKEIIDELNILFMGIF